MRNTKNERRRGGAATSLSLSLSLSLIPFSHVGECVASCKPNSSARLDIVGRSHATADRETENGSASRRRERDEAPTFSNFFKANFNDPNWNWKCKIVICRFPYILSFVCLQIILQHYSLILTITLSGLKFESWQFTRSMFVTRFTWIMQRRVKHCEIKVTREE